MTETVVTVGLGQPAEEKLLHSAIDTFTRWREAVCGVDAVDPELDVPDIMVRTQHGLDGEISKRIVFPNRRCAATFLYIWRSHKRANG
ncbi:MAG: hypothetical protein AAFR41_07265 [Pseudomonadota bacterium]